MCFATSKGSHIRQWVWYYLIHFSNTSYLYFFILISSILSSIFRLHIYTLIPCCCSLSLPPYIASILSFISLLQIYFLCHVVVHCLCHAPIQLKFVIISIQCCKICCFTLTHCVSFTHRVIYKAIDKRSIFKSIFWGGDITMLFAMHVNKDQTTHAITTNEQTRKHNDSLHM